MFKVSEMVSHKGLYVRGKSQEHISIGFGLNIQGILIFSFI